MDRNRLPSVTVYKTSKPQQDISELYIIHAEMLPTALYTKKFWVIKEKHGYWDESEPNPKNKFKNDVTTLSPTDPMHCLTIDEARKAIEEQVLFRVRSGFKYIVIFNPDDAPYITQYEVLPDGERRRMS